MKAPRLSQLRAAARRSRCTVTEHVGPEAHEVILTAEPGRCFEPGLHELVNSECEYETAAERRAEARKNALADLADMPPTELCTDPECEWCADTD